MDKSNLTKKERDLLTKAENLPKSEVERFIEDYQKVIDYCIQDTLLPLRLIDKLDIWTAQIELSNLLGVSVENLLTEGEQARCFSQIYDIFHRAGHVLISKKFSNMASGGGLVTDPEVGIHDNVMTLDFASLYPSIIRSYNLSYETQLMDNRELSHLEGEIWLDSLGQKWIKKSFSQVEILPDPATGKVPNKHTKKAAELSAEVTIRISTSIKMITMDYYQD